MPIEILRKKTKAYEYVSPTLDDDIAAFVENYHRQDFLLAYMHRPKYFPEVLKCKENENLDQVGEKMILNVGTTTPEPAVCPYLVKIIHLHSGLNEWDCVRAGYSACKKQGECALYGTEPCYTDPHDKEAHEKAVKAENERIRKANNASN